MMARHFTALALCAFAGTANAQFAITSHTIDGGGGQSNGGSFTLTGTIAQPDASSPANGGSFSLTGGFWGGSAGPSGYDLWAANNIPANQDRSFNGDANGDGISNAIQYVFGMTPIGPLPPQAGDGGGDLMRRIPAPPSIPPDVNVYLDLSTSNFGTLLQAWQPIVTWENGAPAAFANLAIEQIDDVIVDSSYANPSFYRYRIERRQ